MGGQLLQNGKQAFRDNNGRPLSGGKVYLYQVGTNTLKDTFKDVALTIPNTNPVILNARGECVMFGTGAYRQVLTDASDVLIWDQVLPDLLADINASIDYIFTNSAIRVKGIVDLLALDYTKITNADVKSYYSTFIYPGAPAAGGGSFYYDSTMLKSAHNGGTVISPTVPWNGTTATLPAFLLGTGETQPGAAGCWVRLFSDMSITMFGAVRGTTVIGAVTANDAAGNAAISAASAFSADGSIVNLEVPRGKTYLFGGTFKGTNKSILQPKPNVRLYGGGTLKVQDGANAAAGATGWNFIYPAEDTDPAAGNFEVIGVNFDGNGFNNLNTVMKRNALVGVLTGVGIKVRRCTFTNCPGFHVATFGRDLTAQTVTDLVMTHNKVTNVAEAITGNTGITDHSSFYMLAIDAHADNNKFTTSAASSVASAIEIHGDDSSANSNQYRGYLNLVNIGGYITNTNNVEVKNNNGHNVEMLCRGFTNAAYTMGNITVQANQVVARTSFNTMIDFGLVMNNTLTDTINILDNTLSYAGAVHATNAPACIWVRGVLRTFIRNNTIQNFLGEAVIYDSCPNLADVDISGNTIKDCTRSALATAQAGVRIGNVLGSFRSFTVHNNKFANLKTHGVQSGTLAAVTGTLVSFKGNECVNVPNPINIEGTTSIDRVDIQHQGDTPSLGVNSNSWTKVSVWSEIVCADTGIKWFKGKSGGAFFNQRLQTPAVPVGGTFNVNDIAEIVPASSGSPSEYIYLGAVTGWKGRNVVL